MERPAGGPFIQRASNGNLRLQQKNLDYSIATLLFYSSEGEKVRVGDDLILVSVATERYLVNISLMKSQVVP